MSAGYGGQTMWEPLRRVVARPPDRALPSADPERWHYTGPTDAELAAEEHAAFVALLRGAGAEVIEHEEPLPDHADAIYCHDPVLVTDRGAILLRMGKLLRRGEEEALGRTLERHGVPIVARLDGDALAESGDLLWLDERTLAVGIGFRTNHAGAAQLAKALPGVAIVPVELPWWLGPDACLHLMSLISMVDRDLAVVYPALLPVTFVKLLDERGIVRVEVPEAELATMGTNVLAFGPRRCVMLEGNPVTRSRLEAAGCLVETYRGREISLKAEGGATCLTRPVLRSA